MRSRLVLGVALLALACPSEDPPKPAGTPSASTPSASATTPPPPPRPSIALSATVASRELPAFPAQEKPITLAEADRLLDPREGARIALVDAGAEPRTARRLRLTGGKSERMKIEIDLTMRVQQGGDVTVPPVPPLTVGVELRAVEATDELATMRLRINSAEIGSRGGAKPEGAQEIRPLLTALPGLYAKLRLTAQGVTAEPPQAPSKTPKEVLQLWSTIVEAVIEAIATLPAEPIGVGAKWTVIDRRRRAGITMLRKTDMTLKNNDDDELEITGAFTEVAILGTAHDPALPDEMVLEVESGISTGKRRLTLEVGELWPLSATTELSSDVSVRAALKVGGGDSRTSKVEITQLLKSTRPEH